MLSVHPFRKALAAFTTATAFTARIPTATLPVTTTGLAVFDLFDAALGMAQENYVPDWLQIVPYATAANNVTGDIRILGWNRNAVSPLSSTVWTPQILAQLGVVAGNMAGDAFETGAFMADTITLTYGAAAADGFYGAGIISPANDVPGSIIINTRGCQVIEFQFDVGTATAMNTLWRPIYQRF